MTSSVPPIRHSIVPKEMEEIERNLRSAKTSCRDTPVRPKIAFDDREAKHSTCLRPIPKAVRAWAPKFSSSIFMPNFVATRTSLRRLPRALPRYSSLCLAVDVGGIEEVDAGFDRRVNHVAVACASIRQPKLLRPRPASETSSVPIFRVSMTLMLNAVRWKTSSKPIGDHRACRDRSLQRFHFRGRQIMGSHQKLCRGE